MQKRFARVTLTSILAFSSLFSCVAHATDEIQVYTDDINKPGELNLELHLNDALNAHNTPSYPGELPPYHVLNITPEFSYGLTPRLELGMYLPMSYDTQDRKGYMQGGKLRAKWLNADDEKLYYGLNIELGRVPKRISLEQNEIEIRPIIGTHNGPWHIAFNPIFDVAVSDGNARNSPEFAPSLKINRKFAENLEFGVEHYSSFGAVNDLHTGHGDQPQQTFIVSDFSIGDFDFNLGLGRGWNDATDKWTVKLIIGGIHLAKPK